MTSSEASESDAATAEKERFGWNDVIVIEEESEAAEKVIRNFGFACKDKELSRTRALDPEKISRVSGEILLSITYPNNQPVDRETLRQIMVALKENEKKSIAVRVARLAPGEHFG